MRRETDPLLQKYILVKSSPQAIAPRRFFWGSGNRYGGSSKEVAINIDALSSPGIFFLSGGQTEAMATDNLRAINKLVRPR
jgi:hypothetical protein